MTEGTTQPPEGYLGTDARIGRGPAREMVEAGYELEIAQAPLLHRGLSLADLAHVLSLEGEGKIPASDTRELLTALLELQDTAADEFEYDPMYGDPYNSRERWLEQRIGAAAGWLPAGRPRREAGRIAFRIVLRERVLDLAAAVARFAGALVDTAERHSGTLMADYTYLQAAQPTTFDHYLLSFAFPALRDGEHLREAHAWVNQSPGGAGGVAGSRFPLDRGRLAAMLGFDGFIEHTRDAMWQTDGLVRLVTTATLAVINADRFAEDLEIYTSDEFGLVAIGDEFCRASVLMPQKRNPYALAVIRGGAGTLIGRASGLMATQRTPSARTDNLLYAYGEVSDSVVMATKLVDLAAAIAESLRPDMDAMGRAARSGYSQATDLTEEITRVTKLDYRSAYRVVGRAVAALIEDGGSPGTLDAEMLDRAAREVLGRALEVPSAVIADALDPRSAVATRTTPGGAAPGPMASMIGRCRGLAADLSSWVKERRALAQGAERALLEQARSRVTAPP